MSALLRHSAARDQAWGRFYGRHGARAALTEAAIAPSTHERIARYGALRTARDDYQPVIDALRAKKGLAFQARLRRMAQRSPSPPGVQPGRGSLPPAAQAHTSRLPTTGQQAPLTRRDTPLPVRRKSTERLTVGKDRHSITKPRKNVKGQ